jgi:pyruvate dehydrogenase E2 component (dihydrolipoamide acetyltransferase)
LRKHQGLNAQFIEPATLRRFHRIHLGIMVAIPDGLVLPVLRDADRLALLTLAREARRLVEEARQRHLRQEDYTGATFAVSNLGTYDVTNFTAIINAPQAGILAVGRILERPVVRDGQIVVRPIVEITVSADHRVTDGVGAAEFLVEVKRFLENPVLLVAQ